MSQAADFTEQLRVALADHYTIERELGRGGMATVYLAQDLRHKRRVALKVLHPELADVLGPERFRREIETAAGLQHPHILPVHDSGEIQGWLWYTMPYVEGETLRERLKREGRLEVGEALRLGQEIAGALGAAHAAGVVHRDVKPGNVLLSHGQALVADFGIARSGRPEAGQTLTATGLSLGTPAYMSPEQALGERELDGRSDVYALGCLVYELLTGEPPYIGSTAQAVVSKHLSAPVPDVRRIRPEVPPGVAAALTKALAKVPADRFSSAAEFSTALSPSSRRTGADRFRLPYLRMPPRRFVVFTSSALALTVLGLALTGKLGAFKPQAHTSAPESPTGEGLAPRVVAVLPFEDQDRRYGGPLAEELARLLAQVGSLRVLGPSTTVPYGDSPSGTTQLADKLHAEAVVQGKVRVDDRGLMVDVRVIHATTQRTIWSREYLRKFSSIFQVENDIVRGIAASLGAGLTTADGQRIDRASTRDVAAYDLYLRSTGLSYNNPAENLAGISLLQQAVRRDSTFAYAFAVLARRAQFQAYLGDPSYADSGMGAARRALVLQPDLGAAHNAMGDLLSGQGRPSAARLEFMRAVDLDPNEFLAMGSLSAIDDALGRYDEALYWALRAIHVSPDQPALYTHAADALYHLGVDTVTERWLAGVQQRWPEFERIPIARARLRYAQGHDSLALADLRGYVTRHPENQETQLALAQFAALIGTEDAESLLIARIRSTHGAWGFGAVSNVALLALAKRRRGDLAGAKPIEDSILAGDRAEARAAAKNGAECCSSYELAALYAVRGQSRAALDMLERVNEEGEKDYRYLARDPFFAGLRTNPRFKGILAKMESEVVAMRARAMEANDSLFRGVPRNDDSKKVSTTGHTGARDGA
ncbi:MAG TPA: protein kinase [Gemmatimonadales bacterium]